MHSRRVERQRHAASNQGFPQSGQPIGAGRIVGLLNSLGASASLVMTA